MAISAGRVAPDLGDGPGITKIGLSFVAIGILGAASMGWIVYSALDNSQMNVKPAVSVAASAPKNAEIKVVNATWAALGDLFKQTLPDGTELNIPEKGVEKRLVLFIEDKSKSASQDTWFDFDRLLFDTGKATLQPDSDEQLHNIAAILKAYPKVKMRIGGYTDNTGDKADNLKLSDERAKNVMAELVKLGVEPSRLSEKGYGEEHSIADNSTEEGKQKNRRISMRVTAK